MWGTPNSKLTCVRLLCLILFPGGSNGKASTCNAGDLGSIPGLENHLEKEMATHSSTLAWKIPWMEEPGRLQSMGSWRVGHDWATSLSFFVSDNCQSFTPYHMDLCIKPPHHMAAGFLQGQEFRERVRESQAPIQESQSFYYFDFGNGIPSFLPYSVFTSESINPGHTWG